MSKRNPISDCDIFVSAERKFSEKEKSEYLYNIYYAGNYEMESLTADDVREIIASYSMHLILMKRKEVQMKNETMEFTAADVRLLKEKSTSFNHIVSLIKEAASKGKSCTSLKIFNKEHIIELEKRGFLVGKTVDSCVYNVFWDYDNALKKLVQQNNGTNENK